MRYFFTFVALAAFSVSPVYAATPLAYRLSGKILLQVERNGEAWYVHPETRERHFLYHPDQAYQVMREESVGISNANLARIPMGFYELSGTDTDGDGLVDAMEEAIGTNPSLADTDGDGYNDKMEVQSGYNPLGLGRSATEQSFANRYLGIIFLQVESHGEAWWVNPADGKRYYLGRPDDALALMRAFGLGITNTNLDQIAVTDTRMDCGEEFECLIAATEVGQSATVEWIQSLAAFGFIIKTNALVEIGRTMESWTYQQGALRASVVVTEEQRQVLRDAGKTDEEIAAMEAQASQVADQAGSGVTKTCSFTRQDLFLTYLNQSNEGRFSEEGDVEGKSIVLNVDDGTVLGTCVTTAENS